MIPTYLMMILYNGRMGEGPWGHVNSIDIIETLN
jgi:hypothetical protein